MMLAVTAYFECTTLDLGLPGAGTCSRVEFECVEYIEYQAARGILSVKVLADFATACREYHNEHKMQVR